MGELREGIVHARGLAFPTLESGAVGDPLVLCFHGFPDHPRTWRLLLPELARAGYRAVAPTMRGYAPSAIPEDPNYEIASLSLDALGIADALGAREFVAVGHDWGTGAATGAAILAPDRVRRLVNLAVPYPTFGAALATSYVQQKRSWYMFLFQQPFSEALVSVNNFAFVDNLWADWSPGYRLESEERELLKKSLAQTGVITAALSYYRALFDPTGGDPDLAEDQLKVTTEPVPVETLQLHGRQDGCIGVETLEGMEPFYPAGLEKIVIEDAGHFLHLERPELVHREILKFIGD